MNPRLGVLTISLLALFLFAPAALGQNAISSPVPQAVAATNAAFPLALDANGTALLGLIGPRFIMATAIGVALALAFQLLLTNLSFAAGLNLAGASGSHSFSGSESSNEGHLFDSAKRTVDVLGLWAVGTTVLALFFAGLLAGTIGYVVSPESGAVLGLGVWAIFLLIMVRVETRVLSSLAGSLFSIAGTTLGGALSTTRSLAGSVGSSLTAPGHSSASERVRYDLRNSDASQHQREQVRRMMARLRSEADLSPDSLRELVYEFLHDPQRGTDDLIARLQHIDREHVKEVLMEHDDISEADADEIIARYDGTRTEIINSVDRTRGEVEAYASRAREAAGRSAEKTRQLVAHIAWWSFCTAILSGAAAAVGGTLAALANV